MSATPATVVADPTVRVELVLVAFDGSERATAAVPTARAIAGRFGAQLASVSVVATQSDVDERRAQALDALGLDDSPSDVDVVVADDAATAIGEQWARRDDTLLVLSTRGRGRVGGAILGSVAEAVFAEATEPFVVVGPNADRPGHYVGRPRRRPSNWPEPLSAGVVVALVDGSPSSEKALGAAADWAEALGADLVVLTVAEDAPGGLDGTVPNRFGPADPREYVEGLAADLRARTPRVRAEVVRDPLGVASGIRTRLASTPAAILVLSATRRTGLERLRLGATAADVVRSATAPVLVVPGSSEG
jgi:nucleotide-binding universal stress UspA family protein